MTRATLDALRAARRARKTLVHAVDLASGDQQLMALGHGDPSGGGALDSAARQMILSGQSATTLVAGRRVFLHVHLPPVRVIVIGGGAIGVALVRMAHLAGYEAPLVDPRTAYAGPDQVPAAMVLRAWPDEALRDLRLDPHTAVVALSHDAKLDDPALQVALPSDAFYVGALGGRRSQALRRERLRATGLPSGAIDRLDTPVGLPIGAREPGEIAVAILAGIVAARRKGGV